ncbi:MAG: phosphoribosylformylglycinamidine synthase subunit PurS [Dehalococcoidia bacterium]|nr:phosphoribosylformylglycinamidine synthase subunit PurS [Dehalococcoidia bacterium]
MFVATVRVTLKPTVNDPQGLTIARALATLGFDSVDSVRAGKFIEITLDESDRVVAEKQVNEMCEKLLANPVIERYNFDLNPA